MSGEMSKPFNLEWARGLKHNPNGGCGCNALDTAYSTLEAACAEVSDLRGQLDRTDILDIISENADLLARLEAAVETCGQLEAALEDGLKSTGGAITFQDYGRLNDSLVAAARIRTARTRQTEGEGKEETDAR